MRQRCVKGLLAVLALSCMLLGTASAAPEVHWMDDYYFKPDGYLPLSFSDGPVFLWYKDERAGATCVNVDGTPLLAEPIDSYGRWFSCGLAAVYKDGKAGFIDATGELVIPFQYSATSLFSLDGLCNVSEGERDFYINMSGEDVLDVTDTDFISGAFEEGLAKAWTKVDGKTKYGFMDRSGEIVIPIQFDNAFSFDHGNAEVQKIVDGKKVVGIIDREGNYVIPCGQYDYVSILDDGIIAASNWKAGKAELYCFNPDGTLMFSVDGLCLPASFSNGISLVALEDNRYYGYIDQSGTVIPRQYDNATDFHGGLALVEIDDKIMVIDTTGAIVNSVDIGTELPPGVDDSWTEISSAYFTLGFSEGLAGITVQVEPGSHDKTGFIDRSGAWVIPPIYDDVSPFFEEGVCWVRQGDRVGLLKNPLDVVSPWAEEGVRQAGELKLISANTNRCYPFPITRQKFAELAVNLVEQMTGRELDAGNFPFTDTADRAVRKASAAGLVNGVGNRSKFDPSATITREQLAVMLERTIRYLEQEIGKQVLSTGTLNAYQDAEAVSSWAARSVSTLAASDIMKGTSDATLSPLDTTTVEQAILLTLRAYQAFQ